MRHDVCNVISSIRHFSAASISSVEPSGRINPARTFFSRSFALEGSMMSYKDQDQLIDHGIVDQDFHAPPTCTCLPFPTAPLRCYVYVCVVAAYKQGCLPGAFPPAAVLGAQLAAPAQPGSGLVVERTWVAAPPAFSRATMVYVDVDPGVDHDSGGDRQPMVGRRAVVVRTWLVVLVRQRRPSISEGLAEKLGWPRALILRSRAPDVGDRRMVMCPPSACLQTCSVDGLLRMST